MFKRRRDFEQLWTLLANTLHLFRCSTSGISRSRHTRRTFWKCRISKHRCFY